MVAYLPLRQVSVCMTTDTQGWHQMDGHEGRSI